MTSVQYYCIEFRKEIETDFPLDAGFPDLKSSLILYMDTES